MDYQSRDGFLFALRFYSRGITNLAEGKYQSAIEDLCSAIERGCNTVSAHCELGLARFKLAQTRTAVDSDDPRICYYPASCYLRKVDTDQALEYLNTYIQLNPKAAAALVFRGNLFDDYGLPDKALADYDEAIRLNPEYADAYNKRGQTYSDRKLWDLAIEDASEAIRLDPDLALAYVNRAVAYAALGQGTDSDRDIARGKELGADIICALEIIDELRYRQETGSSAD